MTTSVAMHPLVGDIVITRYPLNPVAMRNGGKQAEPIPATTLGTVLDNRGVLVHVDFGPRGKLHVAAVDLEIVDVRDELVERLENNLGESLLDCIVSQRIIIFDLQTKVDRITRQARDFEQSIETLAEQRDDALAANAGLVEQLEALRYNLGEMADAVVYRAPSHLDSKVKDLLDGLWELSEAFDDSGNLIEVCWNKTIEGDQS
jgi:hypothetical protein